ncbi:amidohydrolase [Clostridium niameyense]|uniref:Amidohydrolase n=1 Tax=Clostridium niameyense TaxID=1622073 RepID=A0A6M0RBT8_9CLOT|nr:amidohydrolase [Clostridium niameyense]NEZ47765.1 amidohydrolase [Clostridium niameyense]
MDVRALSKKNKDYVIKLRREFHKYPEIAFKEFKTSKLIKDELSKLNIEYKTVIDTGIIANIKGRKPGKTLCLRADIDGLAIKEESNLDFKSQNEGFMHACGHDCHIAMLIGACKILNENRNNFNGNIKILFQPAEEIGAGARKVIKEGVLDNVDGVFGIHIWSQMESGSVCVEEGAKWASADVFTINVTGVGGHGSAPHEGVDTIVAASAIVLNLQSISSREISPLEPVVVSIGYIQGGSQYNAISDNVILKGTTRCFNPEIKERFASIIERISKDTAKAYRAEAEVEYIKSPPVLINDKKCSKIAEESCEKIGLKTISFPKILAGEDVAEYMRIVPGAFATLGALNKEKGCVYPHHHPKFKIDEDVLELGVSLHIQYALDFLKQY